MTTRQKLIACLLIAWVVGTLLFFAYDKGWW